jgi:hypothetical protein
MVRLRREQENRHGRAMMRRSEFLRKRRTLENIGRAMGMKAKKWVLRGMNYRWRQREGRK